jgi:hypothetical protein
MNFAEWVNDKVRRVSFQSARGTTEPSGGHRSCRLGFYTGRLDTFVARAPFATPAEIRPLSACRTGRHAQVVAVGVGDSEVPEPPRTVPERLEYRVSSNLVAARTKAPVDTDATSSAECAAKRR